MPNRPIHLATSGPAGAAFAYYNSPYTNDIQRLQEVVGGALGGLLGGLLPDLCDPPRHPGHRAVAHAVLPVGLGATAWIGNLDSWQKDLRDRADEYTRRQSQADDPFLQALDGLLALVFRMLSGMLAGIVAGYVTHICLDFTTPRCLPLII